MYERFTADYTRNEHDKFYMNRNNICKYNGIMNDAADFATEKQLKRVDLWKRFVEQFRINADNDNGWRGEFWGKVMRGASFVYAYTRDKELYDILTETVKDIISAQDEKGRISTYDTEHEFHAWDIWSRKYVLLGMQYFLEICEDDDLKEKIVASMCAQVDYLISKIGNGEGKICITKATRNWRGLNSSSILEPIVRLYNITEEKRYFDFAKYIVDCGGTEVANIFDLAYKDELYPYQYPMTKAYEMTSCFEGLLEFYRVTGNEYYKTAVVNFANKVLESDFTVIGCCGCTHELFDHSTVRQANTTNGEIMQETCVTVTLMKFFYQLNLLTGESKYVDAFERSLYNAYLGAFNTEDVIEKDHLKEMFPSAIPEPLPFDSYSPLTAGIRGKKFGGGQLFADNHYYGCCAAIGSAGIGLVSKIHLLETGNGYVMNLYIDGTVKTVTNDGNDITFTTVTEYPKNGRIEITVDCEKNTSFPICLRIPEWSKNTCLSVNGESIEASNGYVKVEKDWSHDVITLELDMRTQAVYPIAYGTQILMNTVVWEPDYSVPTFDREDPKAKHHIALRRGPIMLAEDARLGYDLDEPIDVEVDCDGYVDANEVADVAPYKNISEISIPLTNGKRINVTDYASAGRLWDKSSEMAVWMLTK